MPCRFSSTNISLLKTAFPDLVVGLSDHFNGIVTGPIAFMLGARVFEKHVTFDRTIRKVLITLFL